MKPLLFLLLAIGTNDIEEALKEPARELKAMEDLVEATQQATGRQKKVLDLLKNYLQDEENCLKDPQNTELLFELARKGQKLLQAIKENGLEDYLSSSFIEELEKLDAIAEKKTIPIEQ